MAKSIRSNVKKRFRAVKRVIATQLIEKPRLAEKFRKVGQVASGVATAERKPKNAFLYPHDEDRVVPRLSVKAPVDFRATSIPSLAGYATRMGRRKFTPDEVAMQEARQEKELPKEIKILAGKGADNDTAGKTANEIHNEEVQKRYKTAEASITNFFKKNKKGAKVEEEAEEEATSTMEVEEGEDKDDKDDKTEAKEKTVTFEQEVDVVKFPTNQNKIFRNLTAQKNSSKKKGPSVKDQLKQQQQNANRSKGEQQQSQKATKKNMKKKKGRK